MARRLRDELACREAVPLSLFIFGGGSQREPLVRALSGLAAGISWLQGDSCDNGQAPSLQAFALSGVQPEPLVWNGPGVGFVYEDDTARFCRLSAVVPARLATSREDQARQVFETAEAMLQAGGFRFSDTVRTWFYLDGLLEWYADFNSVRTAFFKSRGVFDRLVPASTGIGVGNAHGAALTCDLLALQPKPGTSVCAVPSPMQDSAMEYKSSFSRAVEITTSPSRQLLVSGTASIDKKGRTVYAGDPARQLELTMQVVEALLQSRGMDWNDVTRGIAYFKSLGDCPLLERYFKERAIRPFPLAVAATDVCRDDLSFEIEVDAIRR